MQSAVNGLADAPTAPATGQQFDNRRLAAAVVDVLLLVPVALAIKTLFGGWGPTAALLTSAWALYYYFAFESGTGQTIGKRLLGLRVVRKDGGTPSMGEIGVRTALRVVDGLFAYLVGLGVMLATGQRRQRIGDIAAGTVVTAAGPAVAEPEAPLYEDHADLPADTPDPFVPLAPVAEEPVAEYAPEPEAYEFEPAGEEPVAVEPDHVVEPARPEPVVLDPVFPDEPVALEPEPELPPLPEVDVQVVSSPFVDEPVPVDSHEPDVQVVSSPFGEPEDEPAIEIVSSPFSDEPVPVAEPEPEPEAEPRVKFDLPPPASAIDLMMGEAEAAEQPDDEPPAAA